MQSSRPSGERRERSGRRYFVDRRLDERRAAERRLQNMWVAIDRRVGSERRSLERDRRMGRERRLVSDRRGH